MKKLVIIYFILACFSSGYAQKFEVTNAFTYRNRKQLDKAKASIDKAIEHEDTKNDPKTWFYKGNIYLDIHLTDNPKYKDLDPNALEKAYEAYIKANQLDVNKEYTDLIKAPLYICGEQFYNKGVKEYNSKNFDKAVEYFEKTVNINYIYGITDTTSMYNITLAAEFSQNPAIKEKAKKYLKTLVDVKYSQPSVYISLANIYKNEKDTTKALKTIQRGRKVVGDILELVIAETNIYLASGKINEAQENLKLAISKDPNNPNLYFAVGSNYDQIANSEGKSEEEIEKLVAEAEKAYNKAIELKPDYFDAIYNLGALFFNQGVRIFEKCKDIVDNNEYAKCKEKSDSFFNKALPFLEKAYQIQPNDKNTLISLKQLYARMGNHEKYKEIDEKLKSLK